MLLAPSQIAYLKHLFAQARTGSIYGYWIVPSTITYDRAAIGHFAAYAHEHDYSGNFAPRDPSDWDDEYVSFFNDKYALLGHNHDGRYAPIGINFDGTYSDADHAHDYTGTYAEADHLHDDRYARLTDMSGYLGAYAPLTHYHHDLYAPLGHTHSMAWSEDYAPNYIEYVAFGTARYGVSLTPTPATARRVQLFAGGKLIKHTRGVAPNDADFYFSESLPIAQHIAARYIVEGPSSPNVVTGTMTADPASGSYNTTDLYTRCFHVEDFYSISDVGKRHAIQRAINRWEKVIVRFPGDHKLTLSFSWSVLGAGVIGSCGLEKVWDTESHQTVPEDWGSWLAAGSPSIGRYVGGQAHISMSTNYWDDHVKSYCTDGTSRSVNTLTHEIGHALGIGSTWLFPDDSWMGGMRFFDVPSNSNWYTAEHAVAEYKSYFDQYITGGTPLTYIPLENNFGPGSENVHPEEDSTPLRLLFVGVHHFGMGDELMTPVSELDSTPGVPPADTSDAIPLSRVTVGFLHDLGFEVDYSGAETYEPLDVLAEAPP